MADAATAAVDALKAACHAAYRAHPDSCSNAVCDVLRALVDSDMPYHQANALVDALERDWTKVDAATAARLAAQGKVVVGGRKDHPNGHVIIVYPGPAKPRGGYCAVGRNGEEYTLRLEGAYPLAMSTSMGKWPGAKSDGDKTVWDPWGNDAVFRTVSFWHKPGDAGPPAAQDGETPLRMTLSDGYVIEIPREPEG